LACSISFSDIPESFTEDWSSELNDSPAASSLSSSVASILATEFAISDFASVLGLQKAGLLLEPLVSYTWDYVCQLCQSIASFSVFQKSGVCLSLLLLLCAKTSFAAYRPFSYILWQLF